MVVGRSLRITVGTLILALGAGLIPPLGAPRAAGDPPPAPESYRLTGRDAAILAGGAAAFGLGSFVLHSRTQEVPPSGLDPADIALDWDRNSLALPNPDALSGSNLALGASLLSPSAVYVAFGGSETSWAGAGRLWTVEAEAALVAGGITALLKRAASRPRPYAYLSDTQRPDDPAYDVTGEDAFASMPSGHATVAWASALSGATYLAFARPDLPGSVHALGGALAGGFATATCVLRVDAGQHFPSDVVVGSLVGGVTAVGMAYLNRDEASVEGSRGVALRNCLLGAAAGTVIALLFTPPASPFLD